MRLASPAIATRRFDVDDQELFATLTGDRNPIHMDAIAARRTQAGAPVVHGMHALVWALDTLISEGHIAAPVTTLNVQFEKFIYLDVEVALRVVRRSETMLVGSLSVDNLTTTTFSIGYGGPSEERAPPLSSFRVEFNVPAILDLRELSGKAGWMPPVSDQRIAKIFPHACERFGLARIEGLAQLSTLVGMVCPGFYSIYGGFFLKIQPYGENDGISFRVQSVDERFHRAEIAFAGNGISGTVTAFVRQRPVQQRTIRDLTDLVAPNEFRSTTALVIGGSRGLGAFTACALAAGGARVVITYAVGESEARGVAKEINDETGPDTCRVLRYDALGDADHQLHDLDWEINQLYYFATTQIFQQKAELYLPGKFQEFCRIYVDGFHSAYRAVRARTASFLSIFYPSSVAVEQHPRDMTEYSMAKAAGEMLCQDMNRFLRRTRVVVSRLPRILTDQTATVMPIQSSDPVEAIMPIIRKMHGLRTEFADVDDGTLRDQSRD